MEEKLKEEDLLEYLVSDKHTVLASDSLSKQIDEFSADQPALARLFHALQCATDQFKSQTDVPSLSTELAWPPLLKLFDLLLMGNNNGTAADVGIYHHDVVVVQQLIKRRVAVLQVLAELARMSTGSAIGPYLRHMVNLALMPIDGDGGVEDGKSGGGLSTTLAHLTLQELDEKCPSADLRLNALRALSAIMDKANTVQLAQSPEFELCGFGGLFPRVQRVLLALLADKAGGEEVRNLSNKCMTTVIANHDDTNAIFAVLSDMSADTELILKDDQLLDDLIEKCWGKGQQTPRAIRLRPIN